MYTVLYFPEFFHDLVTNVVFFSMKLISKHEIGIRNGIVMPKLYRKEVSHVCRLID